MHIRSPLRAFGFLGLLGCILLDSAPSYSNEALSLDGHEKLIALPVEMDFDFGADNGNAIITRLIPVQSVPLEEDWRLLNTAIIILANAPGGIPGAPGNPHPTPGGYVSGLGDITDAMLFSKVRPDGLIWGFGPIMSFPTATHEQLGSGKWSAGPAFRLAYNSPSWRAGMLAGNLSSFAGDKDRADVNQLLIRGLVRYEYKNDWYFKYSPIITANWNADSGQRWLVPLGGGIGRHIDFLTTPLNVAVEAYANVIKPDGAPDWTFRIAFTLPLRAVGGGNSPDQLFDKVLLNRHLRKESCMR